MTQAGSLAATLLRRILFDPGDGVNRELAEFSASAAIEVEGLTADRLVASNLSHELAEKSGRARYPSAYIYCERIRNTLREKFRTFSGSVEMAIEIRVSEDKEDTLEALVQVYVDAVARVLHRMRGRWAEGVYYPGTYEVSFGPVKRGGCNYVQSALVRLDVQVNY